MKLTVRIYLERAFLAEDTKLLSIINFSKNVCLKLLRNSATPPSDIYRIVASSKLAMFFYLQCNVYLVLVPMLEGLGGVDKRLTFYQ